MVHIPWRPEYARLGYAGGHTDVLSSPFVAAHIAPLITKKVGAAPAALASTQGKVRNPDYERWAKYGIGSYLIVAGHQEFQGVRTPVRLKAILRSKSASRLLVDREYYLTDRDAKIPAQMQSLIAEAWIDPKHHPTTHPQSKKSKARMLPPRISKLEKSCQFSNSVIDDATLTVQLGSG